MDNILIFLGEYLDYVDETVAKIGKNNTISRRLDILISSKIFTADELRKELSLIIKRIISQKEFEQLLDITQAECSDLLYELYMQSNGVRTY